MPEREPTTTPYLTGFKVKPASVSPFGIVTYTDGVSNSTPNQMQCEAYGYTYNSAEGTCSAFNYNHNLNRSFDNINNNTQGVGNVIGTGVNNTCIMGENNVVNNRSRNNIIIGSENEIANRVNNANVFGSKAEATVDNSLVLGAGSGAEILGKRQYSTFMYGVKTTVGTTKASYLNGLVDSYFEIKPNTAFYFQCDVLAVRTGGTGAGTTGDFASFTERGVVSNVLLGSDIRIGRERDNVQSSGTTTTWRPTAAISGTNFVVNVRGAADVDVEWAITVKITQIKTA